MTIFYLETSALVKRYKTEGGSQVVGELFEQSTEGEILTTSQLTGS